ncbi:MAG TPA: flavin reductase family protein [Blastocatellia bacterium]|nr:flavin reductase family protein [Blastocatellia bacterium]
MPIDDDEFRSTLSLFASGVTVVTTCDAGRLHGLTVSAFSSLSLRPPLVLICVNSQNGSRKAVADSRVFAVNFLSDLQENLSRRFASRAPDKFEGIAYTRGIGDVPVLAGALASLECRLVHAYEGGDHTIFVGEIERVTRTSGEPLLYYRGSYARLTA